MYFANKDWRQWETYDCVDTDPVECDASRSLPASLVAQIVDQLQATVADPGTTARLYAPALECLRRIVVCRPPETLNGGYGAGMRAAREVMLSKWGLVDQQNNRGW